MVFRSLKGKEIRTYFELTVAAAYTQHTNNSKPGSSVGRKGNLIKAGGWGQTLTRWNMYISYEKKKKKQVLISTYRYNFQ